MKNLSFEVAEEDLKGTFTWPEAMAEAEALGGGWRLPTKDELDEMFLCKDEIGGFVHDCYWSSSELDSGSAWLQSSVTGGQYDYNKDDNLRVRVVRDKKPLEKDYSLARRKRCQIGKTAKMRVWSDRLYAMLRIYHSCATLLAKGE